MEITRNYKTVDVHDVVVCGGGPAGVAAAVAAARKGAKTLLIERGGCLAVFGRGVCSPGSLIRKEKRVLSTR